MHLKYVAAAAATVNHMNERFDFLFFLQHLNTYIRTTV